MGIYLQAADLKALSEFAVVKTKHPAVLESVYITRAEITAGQYGPFTYAGDDAQRFRTEMRLAVFLIAERMVLAQPSAAAAAAGLSSENLGRYSYSRAQGGGNVGKREANEIVPQEAIAIFDTWRVEGEDELTVTREAVFSDNYLTDAEEPGLTIFHSEVGHPSEWVGQSQ